MRFFFLLLCLITLNSAFAAPWVNLFSGSATVVLLMENGTNPAFWSKELIFPVSGNVGEVAMRDRFVARVEFNTDCAGVPCSFHLQIDKSARFTSLPLPETGLGSAGNPLDIFDSRLRFSAPTDGVSTWLTYSDLQAELRRVNSSIFYELVRDTGPSFDIGFGYWLLPYRLIRNVVAGVPSGDLMTSADGIIKVKIVEEQDSIFRFVRSANGWLPDSNDPDWSKIDGNVLASFVTPAAFSLQGSTTGNRRLDASVSSSVRLFALDVADSNFSRYRELVINQANQIAVYKDDLYRGSVQNLYESVSTIGPVSPLSGSAGSNSESGSSSDSLAEMKIITKGLDDLIKPSQAPVLPDLSTDKFEDVFFKDFFSGLIGWRIPSHLAECARGEFVLFNKAMYLDGHCTLMNDHKSLLRSVMVLVFSILALRVVLKA